LSQNGYGLEAEEEEVVVEVVVEGGGSILNLT
jgi:hypothetical protein